MARFRSNVRNCVGVRVIVSVGVRFELNNNPGFNLGTFCIKIFLEIWIFLRLNFSKEAYKKTRR